MRTATTTWPLAPRAEVALVALLAALPFLPGLFGDFLTWDDDRNFLHNPHYRGLGPEQLRWAFTTFHMGHWKPLTWLSLGLDHALWGLDPRGYHLSNLGLHALNAALVLLLARRLIALALGRPPADLACRAGAGLAALAFAVHPLRVESVVWITERRDVLSAFFYLAAALAWLRAVAPADGAAPATPARRPYWASVALFAAGLLSKSMVVTLPAALLILDVYPLRRLGGRAGWGAATVRPLLWEKAPYLVLAAAASAVAFVALAEVRNAPGLAQMDVATRVAVSFYGLAFYLWKTLQPTGLAHLYELVLPVDPLAPVFLASAGAVAVIGLTAWLLRRRCPGLAAAGACYGVTLLPVLGIFQNGPQIAADRYSYLACLGWGVLAGGGLARLLRVPAARLRRGLVAGLTLALVGALVALAAAAARQSLVWTDSFTLWTRALAIDPASPRARTGYGALLLAHGAPERAIPEFEAALRRHPTQAEGLMGLALALGATGRPAAALPLARQAMALRPWDPGMRHHLGLVLRAAGDHAGAARALEEAARQAGGSPGAQHALAVVLAEQGRREDALRALERGNRLARALDPRDPEVERYTALVLGHWDPPAAAAAWRRYLATLGGRPAPTALDLRRMAQARAALAGLEEAGARSPAR
jgi:tetratricopeptide (TPR) repeat protein